MSVQSKYFPMLQTLNTFPLRRLAGAALLGLSLTSFSGCKDDDDDKPTPTVSVAEAKKAAVSTYSDIVYATYTDALTAARTLDTKAQAFVAAPTAGGLHADIGEAEQALNGALRDGDLLDVGEAHGRLLQAQDAGADAQAAICDDIPVQLEIEAHEDEGDR